MSNYIQVVCHECGKKVHKTISEYNRRSKKAKKEEKEPTFFCNLSCTRTYLNKQITPEQSSERSRKAVLSRNFPISFRYYIRKAKSRHKPHWDISNLTHEYLEELWASQKGLCALSGIPLSVWKEKGNSTFSQASLDRIDSSIGYVIGNVQFIVAALNLAKQGNNDEEFKLFLETISYNIIKNK